MLFARILLLTHIVHVTTICQFSAGAFGGLNYRDNVISQPTCTKKQQPGRFSLLAFRTGGPCSTPFFQHVWNKTYFSSVFASALPKVSAKRILNMFFHLSFSFFWICCFLLLFFVIVFVVVSLLFCLSARVFYLTVDTLYVSFVSPGCQPARIKIARITVVAGHSDLLIMGWGSDVAG